MRKLLTQNGSKRTSKRVAAALLSMTMALTLAQPVPSADAAAKQPSISTKATLNINASKKLTIKKNGYTIKSVKVKTGKKSIAVAKATKKAVTVYGVKNGKTTITATVKAAKKGAKTKTFTLTTNVTVNDVKASLSAKSLAAGKTAKVTVKNAVKGATLTYKSADTKVATVSAKGVVTAVAAGQAKITVSIALPKVGKVVKAKTITRTAGTVTVTGAKETAAPTVAPTAEPTAEATVVPTAEPTAEATADASAAPTAEATADASAAPTAEASQGPSVVKEIKLLNTVALTGKKDTEAYVYYDVLDQYGNSVRMSEDVQWTTSPDNKVVDKVAGKITFKTTDEKNLFTYGKQLYLNAVHVKTGTVLSTSVTCGLAQAVDTVKFGGFVSKNDPTKKMESLPAGFAKDTYYMLFQTFDQNGNLLDVTDDTYGLSNVTFVNDSPLLMSLDSKQLKNYTIGGVDYAGIMVVPETYVDKGGEVNITAIGNKTGGKTTINVKVGTTGLLKSVELQAPTTIIADGDSGVEIPYVAKDTEGNEIKNYETIVRSSNNLQVSASVGTLKVYEKNDGTAGITWSDDSAYNPKKSATYANSEVSNGVARSVALTTVVVGGESNNMMLSVNDIRIPTTIVGTKKELSDYYAAGTDVTLNIDGIKSDALDGRYDSTFTYQDQYGKELNNMKANAFFKYANTNKFGSSSDAAKYAIRMDAPSNTKYGVTSGSSLWADGSEITLNVKSVDDNNAAADVRAETFKFYVAKCSEAADEPKPANWSTVGKAFTKTISAVAPKNIKNYEISGLDNKIEIAGGTGYAFDWDTALDPTDNEKNTRGSLMGKTTIKAGADKDTNVVVSGNIYPVVRYGYNDDFVKWDVVGKYNGSVVTLPHNKGYFTVNAESHFEKFENAERGRLGQMLVTPKSGSLFDFNSYNNPYKNGSATFKLDVVDITNGNSALSTVSKDVTVSAEPGKITKIEFYGSKVLNPSNTMITSGSTVASASEEEDFGWNDHTDTTGIVLYCADADWAHKKVPAIKTLNQYGVWQKVSGSGKIVYTATDYVENDGQFGHKSGNASIVSNGTANMYIDGAEILDKFKLKATAVDEEVSVSATVELTVGADKLAYINDDYDSDKAFRKAKLGYPDK